MVNTENIITNIIDSEIKNSLHRLTEAITALCKEYDGWIPCEVVGSGTVFYNALVGGIFPDLTKFKCSFSSCYRDFDSAKFNKKFLDFTGDLLTVDEVKILFVEHIDAFKHSFPNFFWDRGFSTLKSAIQLNPFRKLEWNCNDQYNFCDIPLFRLNLENKDKQDGETILIKFFENNLIPQFSSEMKDDLYNLYRGWMKLFELGYCHYSEDGNYKFDLELIKETILNSDDEYLSLFLTSIKNKLQVYLLSCDKLSSDLEPYDIKLLTDPNRGHWLLWEQELDPCYQWIARNPLNDIREDGFVGIDFGTKSTVVVYQGKDENTFPMRIGTGDLKRTLRSSDYENPTVLECINLTNFLDSYKIENGRPATKWEDLTTSHTAEQGFRDSKSEHYYAYLTELKQWAGGINHFIKLRDKQEFDTILKPFLEVNDGDLNPIELYAYFIGLYINNMRNGIYLDYSLSFPVTYEKAVREKIIQSFTLGIKKSLPNSILNNESIMQKFKVRMGISEPAAYAITALKQYGFTPADENEKYFYGIFDFGGGTTDFDFGLWRGANQSESRRYDYVLECFGANGDRFLGGENLLELLAFELFKSNQDKLRANEITFTLPSECTPFPGSEILLSQSQEAKLNTKKLVEKLRPFWERKDDESLSVYQEEILKVDLTNHHGQLQIGFELSFSSEKMEEIIKNRIERGIINFFESLRMAFNMPETTDITQVNIFLAGNSSKSKFVTDLFETYIEKEEKEINGDSSSPLSLHKDTVSWSIDDVSKQGLTGYGFDSNISFTGDLPSKQSGSLFALYPPLGTEESIEKRKSLGVIVDSTDITSPSGKTGVAYGLIDSAPGSKVKVIQHNISNDNQEIRFKYFIGYKSKEKFKIISDRDLAYNSWVELIDAEEEDFIIHYSSLPEASTNNLSILSVNRKKCHINNTYQDAFIYYKAINPNTIVYVVARPEDLKEDRYLEEPIEVKLD